MCFYTAEFGKTVSLLRDTNTEEVLRFRDSLVC